MGLGFQQRVGKDSTGEILVRDYGFKRLSFADHLKQTALAVNPVVNGSHHLAEVVHEAGWEAAKVLFPESRIFLQRMGVAIRDHVNSDWLIDPVIQTINDMTNDVVITDVRFLNECAALKRVQADPVFIVNIQRPGYGEGDSHVSETELRNYPFDYTLHNDGSLEDLPFRVEVMMRKLCS